VGLPARLPHLEALTAAPWRSIASSTSQLISPQQPPVRNKHADMSPFGDSDDDIVEVQVAMRQRSARAPPHGAVGELSNVPDHVAFPPKCSKRRSRKAATVAASSGTAAAPIRDMASDTPCEVDGTVNHTHANVAVALKRAAAEATSTAADAATAGPAVSHVGATFHMSDDESSDSDGEARAVRNRRAADLARRSSQRQSPYKLAVSLLRETVASDFGFSLSGGYAGRHVVLYIDDEACGLQSRDEIVEVNGEDVTAMELCEIDEAIQESPMADGLRVDLVILRAPLTALPVKIDASEGSEQLSIAQVDRAVRKVAIEPVAAHDFSSSSDEEPALLPPPVFSTALRSTGDHHEDVAPLVKGGKFSEDGHAEALKTRALSASKAESRMMVLVCVLGFGVMLLTVLSLLAASSDSRLIESFHFGSASEVITNTSEVGEALLGLRFTRLRFGASGPSTSVKFDSVGCTAATPVLNGHICTACKDAGAWVSRVLAVLILLNVVRVDVVLPRRTAQGNGLCRRILSVALSAVCLLCDVIILYEFREHCYLEWRDDPEVSTTYGPGAVLCGLATVLDAVILFITCATPHTHLPL